MRWRRWVQVEEMGTGGRIKVLEIALSYWRWMSEVRNTVKSL
jgi:hypothetical protein